MGKQWLRGDLEIDSFQGIKFNEKQKEYINAKDRFNLISGGMASGKTLAFIVKFILLMLWFPGTRILIGRKSMKNAQSTFMKDFVDVCPPELYEHQKGYGKINFINGSEAVFMGLDALQSGSGDDLKKAVQEIKSHNFGFIFIDQLEEIQKKVFEALNSRLRRSQCKHPQAAKDTVKEGDNPIYEICNTCGKYSFNQMNFTCNPANFWAYDFFKDDPQPMTNLIETSMMDNKENLSEGFVQSELNKPDRYVKKFVFGEWTDDVPEDQTVFASDYISQQKLYVKEPEREMDGIKIFENPGRKQYRIGVDPSTGSVDPSCIKVFCTDDGREVASYTGFLKSYDALADKVATLGEMYSILKKPVVVPEANGQGAALIESLKKVYPKIYERESFNRRENKKTTKLGFHTNHSTKSLLIEHFKELLNRNFVRISERETINEMRNFIWQNSAQKQGAGAAKGKHDDRVMATMLALYGVEATSAKEKSILDRVQKVQEKSKIAYQWE